MVVTSEQRRRRTSAFRLAGRAGGMRPSAVREILKATESPGVISFGGGMPAPELFPADAVAAACVAALAADGAGALQYGTTEGYGPLREWVAAHVAEAAGVRCEGSEVLILAGSQQGLDLMGKVLLDPGDVVVVADPAYFGAVQAFRAYEAEVVGVPSDADGVRADELLRALSRYGRRVKLLYLCPNFHNPTGETMSGPRRAEVAALAGEFDVPVLEDDPYGRLRYAGADVPALCAQMASRDGWVYLGSSSKVVSPGLRVGWMVVPDEELRRRLVVAKQGTDLHTSSFAQRVVWRYMSQPGVLAGHVAKLREVYGRRREVMLAALGRHMPAGWAWTRPEGGMFLWVTGPEGVDGAEVARRAAGKGVVVVPGGTFCVGTPRANTLRLNFSNAEEDRIEEGVRRLGEVARE